MVGLLSHPEARSFVGAIREGCRFLLIATWSGGMIRRGGVGTTLHRHRAPLVAQASLSLQRRERGGIIFGSALFSDVQHAFVSSDVEWAWLVASCTLYKVYLLRCLPGSERHQRCDIPHLAISSITVRQPRTAP